MNEDLVYRQGNYRISTDRAELDLTFLHDFLSIQSYWARGIPRETMEKSLGGSICFGLYSEERQIGFARVITDEATFAYLADVFIDEAFRGQGLSKWLIAVIMAFPSLQGLRNWMLATRDAHNLYAQFGFSPLSEPERIMRKQDPESYGRLNQDGRPSSVPEESPIRRTSPQ